MKTVLAAMLYFLLGLVGSGLCAAHANPDPSILGDNMQSFTEDPYMTDEKFREKGKSDEIFNTTARFEPVSPISGNFLFKTRKTSEHIIVCNSTF